MGVTKDILLSVAGAVAGGSSKDGLADADAPHPVGQVGQAAVTAAIEYGLAFLGAQLA